MGRILQDHQEFTTWGKDSPPTCWLAAKHLLLSSDLVSVADNYANIKQRKRKRHNLLNNIYVPSIKCSFCRAVTWDSYINLNCHCKWERKEKCFLTEAASLLGDYSCVGRSTWLRTELVLRSTDEQKRGEIIIFLFREKDHLPMVVWLLLSPESSCWWVTALGFHLSWWWVLTRLSLLASWPLF